MSNEFHLAPPHDYDEFLAAPSKGFFFNQQLKDGPTAVERPGERSGRPTERVSTLDRELAIVMLTALLAGITAYYAWQNRRMVDEMRQSREISVRPKLVISILMLGPTYGLARLVNSGQGPALEVDVALAFHRRDGSGSIERKWQSNFMPPGEVHDFIEPDELGDIQTMEALAAACSEITVKGNMKSSLGTEVQVDETTGDLQDWFDMSASALHVWEEEPRRKIPKELEKIRKELEKVNKWLSKH
jgi:hypothetical protein